ncbi:hypothetical protein PsB1_0075 [Candidatus Phycosocius spiralis]|uniref:Uncharacterized protein n=1 Tax=Candidatus Phycosocius spiralis TaxID=2815099 RepID=A0ABQ4PSD7_9PROT|nr:hypothetical protein PsB1_0075 [Candidatus Phycosocius spiralis]
MTGELGDRVVLGDDPDLGLTRLLAFPPDFALGGVGLLGLPELELAP